MYVYYDVYIVFYTILLNSILNFLKYFYRIGLKTICIENPKRDL